MPVNADYLRQLLTEYQQAEAQNMELAAYNHGAAIAVQKLLEDIEREEKAQVKDDNAH